MPARLLPENIARIQELAAQGKSSRTIATETGIGKSSVARYMAPSPISASAVDMLSDNNARSFLNEIGITAPAASLRNETLPATNPLKNNPKVLLLAEKLMGSTQPVVSRRLEVPQNTIVSSPEPQSPGPDTASLMARIQMNVECFGPLIKHIVKPDADTFLKELFYKDDQELALLLKVIERSRLTGNMANQFKNIFWMTSNALEAGAPVIGIKAQGLTQSLRQQEEEIQLILREMALDRADSLEQAQRPEIRLAFLVSTTLLSVDLLNRKRALSAKPPEVVAESFKDL